MVYSTAPMTKDYLAQNINSATNKKLLLIFKQNSHQFFLFTRDWFNAWYIKKETGHQNLHL